MLCKKHGGTYISGATSHPTLCGICLPFKCNPFAVPPKEATKKARVPASKSGPLPKKCTPHDPMLPFDTKYCKCPSCGAYFGGAKAFDMHRVRGRVGSGEDRGCQPPSSVADKHGKPKLKMNNRGYWVQNAVGFK